MKQRGEDFFKGRYNVSCETLKKFKFFRDELLLFQKKFNLIGRGTIEDIWIRHFADSAELLRNLQGLKSKKILDFGTGAGFPGLVIVLLSENYRLNHKITLAESNVKKYNFLMHIKKKLELRVDIYNKRVEDLYNENFDIITARAVAPLDRLLAYLEKFNLKNTHLIFPKGKTWEEEIKVIKNFWKFDEIIVRNNHEIDSSGGVVVIIRNLIKR